MANNQQSVLIYDRIDANKRRTRFLLALFGLTLLPFIAALLPVLFFMPYLGVLAVYVLGVWGFLIVVPTLVLVIVVVFVCLGYLQADRLILRIARARPVRRDEALGLWQAVENLCIGAGLPQPRLYVAESAAPNAFAIGLNPSHASIIVTRGLLQLLDRRELEGVVAHELSHIANYDTRVSTVAAALTYTLRLPRAASFRLNSFIGIVMLVISYTGFVMFFIGLLFPVALTLIGNSEMMVRFQGALIPWLLELFVGGSPGYVYVLAPKVARHLQSLVSQEREFLADADAVLLTRYPEGLARALAKLSTVDMSLLKVDSATTHLYIVKPSGVTSAWWDEPVQTHPPIEERISLLARMGSGIPASVLEAAEQAGTEYRYSQHDTADADAGPPETKLPSGESTARAQPRLLAGAFRLTGSNTPLYRGPNAASAQLGQLENGTLVVVTDSEEDFLRVITSGGRAGFIPSSASMTSVNIPSSTFSVPSPPPQVPIDFTMEKKGIIKSVTKYRINDKEYNSLEEVPGNLRALFEDKNQDGTPDIFEGKEAIVIEKDKTELREIPELKGIERSLNKGWGIFFLAMALFGERLLPRLPEGVTVVLSFIALIIGFVLLVARRRDGRLVVGYGQGVMDAKKLIILLASCVIFIALVMLLVNNTR